MAQLAFSIAHGCDVDFQQYQLLETMSQQCAITNASWAMIFTVRSRVGCRSAVAKPHDLTRNAHGSLVRSISANVSRFAENDLSIERWQIRFSV